MAASITTTKDNSTPEQNDDEIAKASLDAYGYCTNVLRAWFGAYSIGVPALILSSDKLRQMMLASGRSKEVLSCFAGAIALQVFLTFVNKYSQYGVYERYGSSKTKNWMTAGAEAISDWLWVDFVSDVGTITFLVIGSFLTFDILASIPK